MIPETYALIAEYLGRFYDTPLYQRHEISHPVIQHRPSIAQSYDVNSVIGHLTADTPSKDTMGFYNYAYLHTLQNSGRHLFNGTTFALKRLRTNPLRIDATLGTYYDMLATCIALESELLDVMSAGMIRLPMRSQYHRTFDAQQALTSGKGRSATLGGVMLTVFNDEGIYKAIVSQRTGQHATRPNALHLLPAFIFQPMNAENPTDEWTFKHHLYREYLEELVGMAEGTHEMEQHPALRDLKAMEADGRAEIRLTGVSMNLLTLRAEISTLLIIHDPDWWRALQSGENGYQLNTPETQNTVLLIPIADDESALATLPDDYYLTMVPQAIPAFWDGLDMARSIVG
ncbi:MAG: hypothetical protein WBC91_00835 [Phototrophicaceae bacterium]